MRIVTRFGSSFLLVLMGASMLPAVSLATPPPLRICVPEKEGAAVKTPKKGVCAAKTTSTVVLPEAEEEKLAALLPYERYVASGVGSKPTIQIAGANLQILSGTGASYELNGAGNLIVGYDETPGEQTGSNNIVLGGREQTYLSWGSLIGGSRNTDMLASPEALLCGNANTTYDAWDSITGGDLNQISGQDSSISGGSQNEIRGPIASISGGDRNTVTGIAGSVSGGQSNFARGGVSWVAGGEENFAEGPQSSVVGGETNMATGKESTIAGGRANVATSEYASVFGGEKNAAEAKLSSVAGGKEQVALVEYEALL
jgi:hypothetical protein